MAEAIEHTTIFARTNPDHKLKIINALQSKGAIVAMTGDGVNEPIDRALDVGKFFLALASLASYSDSHVFPLRAEGSLCYTRSDRVADIMLVKSFQEVQHSNI